MDKDNSEWFYIRVVCDNCNHVIESRGNKTTVAIETKPKDEYDD